MSLSPELPNTAPAAAVVNGLSVLTVGSPVIVGFLVLSDALSRVEASQPKNTVPDIEDSGSVGVVKLEPLL